MGMPAPEIVQCPHCWAPNPAIESRCRACARPLAVYIGPPLAASPRFGLGSVMLVVAVAALCLAAGRQSPALGIFAGCVSALALLRTHAAIGSEVALGLRPTNGRRASVLLGSIGIGIVLLVTAGFVFGLVTIVVGGMLSAILGVGGALTGGLAGLVAAVVVAHRLRGELWPVRD